MLRYQENNELHMDFHGTTNATLEYIAGKYGVEALEMILRRTGSRVYKSIHDKLAAGDASELIEHLNWFFNREKGWYNLSVSPEEIVFEVLECPAIRHLRKLGLEPSEHICLQTRCVNEGMCENTMWHASLEILGEGHCIQRFKKEL